MLGTGRTTRTLNTRAKNPRLAKTIIKKDTLPTTKSTTTNIKSLRSFATRQTRSLASLRQNMQAMEDTLSAINNDIIQLQQFRLQQISRLESKAYQILSNIMKAQHDTAQAIIKNMKA